MLRSQDVSKVTIMGLNSDRQIILSALHKLGVIQPIDIKLSEIKMEGISKPDISNDLSSLSDKLLRVSRIVHVLKLAKEKLPFAQSMFGLDLLDPVKVKNLDATEILEDATDFLKDNEETIIGLEEKYNGFLEKAEELADSKKLIKIFKEVNLPMTLLRDTEHVSIVSGKLSSQNKGKLQSSLKKEFGNDHEVFIKDNSAKESVVVVLTFKKNFAKLNYILKKVGVNTFSIPDVPDKPDLLKWVNEALVENQKSTDKVLVDIKKQKKNVFSGAVVIREELEILKERFEVLHLAVKGKNFFALYGWVLSKNVDKVTRKLEELTGNKVAVESVLADEKEEGVPVELSNPAFLKPFELLTELYAPPKYKDLDPTFIIGPIFIVYAAFMLTDAVYGMGLAIFGTILLVKFSKYSKGLKNISINILSMGLLCTFFGVLTGSYFGDLPKYFIGKTSAELAFWRDPLTDPLYFLILSIGVGLVYLNVGIILGCIEDFRKKDYKELLKSRLVWFLLQISIALIYFNVGGSLGKYLFGFTVLLIVILSGPLGLLDITGFMGDTISFSRLFALALSTAGIALAVNLLANLVLPIPYLGWFFAILIFIGGHTFGFVMNSIGAFVHSLRLQFVEFFGRFYEGGGDKFAPLIEDRQYTEVKN